MRKNNLRRKDFYGYFYILPSFIFIVVFAVIPIFMALYFSLCKYNVIQPPVFTGMDNYKRLIADPFTKASIKNTFVYTLIVVPIQTILSMIMAALIAGNCKSKFGNFIKSSLFIPVISSMIIVGTIWKFMLGTEGGLINNILSLVAVPGINWLGSATWSLISVCIVAIWKNIGYFLIIYYAGIMDIPKSLYEAGIVDGATKLQQFFYITLPCLRPITYLVVTLGTIWSFQVFDLVYTMTGGGPGTSTVTLVLTIYNTAFKEYSMGYACSVAILLFAIIMLISAVQKKILAKED